MVTVDVATEQHTRPETGFRRGAAVSSFGLRGTSAHAVLGPESADQLPDPSFADGPVPVLLSGRSEAATQALAGRLLGILDIGAHPLEVGLSLATGRASVEYRAAVIAENADALARGLAAVRDGVPASGVVTGSPVRGGLAVLFAGQGGQRLRMGLGLCERHSLFAAEFEAVLAHFDRDLECPMREAIAARPDLLGRTVYAQPALFAMEVALYRLVASWGVVPDFVLGHSVGEIAAAYVAGVLSLADACTLVAARGRLMQAVPERGAMVAVEATEDEVVALLSDEVSVAGVNAPDSTVVSGDEDVVLAIAAYFAAAGRRIRRLRVSRAFHSPHMDGMLDEFRRLASTLDYHPPHMTVVSTLTGDVVNADAFASPEYWVRHARDTVRFGDAVSRTAALGARTFLELGPDATLSGLAHRVLRDLSSVAAAVPVLQENRPEELTLVTALATLYTRGVSVNWPGFFSGTRVSTATTAP